MATPKLDIVSANQTRLFRQLDLIWKLCEPGQKINVRYDLTERQCFRLVVYACRASHRFSNTAFDTLRELKTHVWGWLKDSPYAVTELAHTRGLSTMGWRLTVYRLPLHSTQEETLAIIEPTWVYHPRKLKVKVK